MSSKLFSPYQLGPMALTNRIAIAPMCQYSADEGLATDWHMIHLGHLALSGAALLIIEATAVTPEGRISPDDLGLWSDAHLDALKYPHDYAEHPGGHTVAYWAAHGPALLDTVDRFFAPSEE